MAEIRTGSERKAAWSPTPEAFENFLKWLDGGRDSEGRTYLEMRRRLVAYFERKNCEIADDLADETLSRVTRRLAEVGAIDAETPAKFCYITARFVFLEHLRTVEKKGFALDSTKLNGRHALRYEDGREEADSKEWALSCLDRCIQELNEANRGLIVGYYFGTEREKIENRRAIAAKLGITVNALSIRACRIREKLEACMNKCSDT